MSAILQLKNYNDLFLRTKNEKFLLNREDLLNKENKERLDNLIMSNYSDDNLSLIPTCSCGELKGTYYVGSTCGKCNTMVKSTVDDNLSYLLWVERPEHVQMFISPIVLAILLQRYKITRPSVQLVAYIIVPNMRIEARQNNKTVEGLDKLDFLLNAAGIGRGYNNFVENFFKIIEILEDNFTRVNKKEKKEFYDWLFSNKDNIFSNYLPFPNKSIFTVDSNELGSFIDRSLLDPLNAMRRLTGIDLHTQTPNSKQVKVARSLIELSGFYRKYLDNSFFKKPGLIRQHISSTRSHFTARAVITSIPGPCSYEELHLPWSLSCTLFREHILKGLYKRGYSYKKAIDFFMFHNKIYSPVIDEIFNDMLMATKGGIDVIFIRNPSLHRGSVQALKVTKFKTDTDDNTISMSLSVLNGFNADFDGDSMNLKLILTQKAIKQLDNFKPHHSVLALTGPDEFGGAIQYPKTLISTLANWYNNGSSK